MRRRALFSLPAALLGAIGGAPLVSAAARANSVNVDLRTAPLELGGTWTGSAPTDAGAVITRMRLACLTGAALLSDHQPEKLRVDDHAGSNPSIWLHAENPDTAWIIVIVGARDWCNLSYQFGHEFGHVFCNSWRPDAKPQNPCQWLEEALVEAFSLRGLGLLADAWATDPPFPDDGAYAAAIRSYRDTILASYRAAAHAQGMAEGAAAWFRGQAAYLSGHGGLTDAKGAVALMFDLLVRDAGLVTDLGALNRWPGRAGVPLDVYFRAWRESCAAIGAPGLLPARLAHLFAIT